MRILFDTLEAPGDVARTAQGWEIRRAAKVIDIGGAPANRLVRAALAPGLPAIGSAHPLAPGAVLDRIEVAGYDTDTDSARLALIYRTRNAENLPGTGPARGGAKVLGVEFFAQTQTERATEDANGERMLSKFFGRWQNPDGTTAPFLIAWEEVEVDVYRPYLGVRIRHERAALPRDLAPRMVGATNADRWSGYPPYTWLCTGFSTDNQSGQWVSVFEALYRPNGWRYTHVLKWDGRPINAAVPGNGINTFDVYPARNFAETGLAF